MKIDLEALRRNAVAATPGPWAAEGRGMGLTVLFAGAVPGSRPSPCLIADGLPKEREANANHIASCDPQTILSLIAVVEKARNIESESEFFCELVDTPIAREVAREKFAALRSALEPFVKEGE